jgi:tetratricopeptide (TPR) repeat protein
MKYKFQVILIFIVWNSLAQNKTIDSLNTLLRSTKEDTTQLRLYFALANACDVKDNLKYAEPAIALIDKLILKTSDEKEKRKLFKRKADAISFIIFYYQRNPDENKFLENTQKKLSLCEQIKDSACILYSYMNIAAHYRNQGNLPEALENYKKGLSACIKLNYKEGIARSNAELADMYLDQGDTVHAIELYKKVVSIAEGMNNKTLLARAIMQAGGVYNAIRNFTKALEYYEKARLMFEATNDKLGLMEIYKNSGDTYNAKKDYEKALLDYKKAVQLAEEMKKPVAVVNFMGRMANAYANMSDYKNAVECIDQAIRYNKEHLESGGNMQTWLKSKLAVIYYKKKEYKKAKQYSDMTLATMKAANAADIDMELEKLAAKIDSACGNYKEAYFHYQQYILLRDKLNSEEVRKAATKEKYQSEYDKQKAIDKAEQDKKDLETSQEKRRQKIITFSVISVLVLVAVFALFMFRSLRITRKQKEIIEIKEQETLRQKHLVEEKNKEVMDSIRYARRIQSSLMPTEKYLDKIFKVLTKK